MWGFHNKRDRNLGKEIFKKIIDPSIAKKYHTSGTKTKTGPDQFFLADHVYPLIKSRSIIHDSYTCKNYENSKPFPTKRVADCFIGDSDMAGCGNKTFHECPVACRPDNHQDWIFC